MSSLFAGSIVIQKHFALYTNVAFSSGVWIDVLEAIGVLAVIANGLVIGVSSDFIPRLVYRYRYGPCVNGTETDIE